ncbi:unnamed protein product [Adineta steineri]|uniref:Uncharacterized protein n=1 Tax=Adineta steineri TaxID=433720 RepID=A0A818VNE7_9BILA|nr:unnamed protein product [Adineta steineri]CAF3712319.1 unnamed protein product [Adineta steineri]
MSSNSSSITTGHAYRLRPMTSTSSTNNSSISGPSSSTGANHSGSTSYYGTSATAAPVVASPTWSYSSPSQLARKYANIAPIWCHITKPRQLKKKFASTFHQAQSLAGFYNDDRAPSERRGSLTQAQQNKNENQVQSTQQSQSSTHTPHHYESSSSYRQPYTSHYSPRDPNIESSSTSTSKSKKKYTGNALTIHIPSRLQSPPNEEKFSTPTERRARIDQLKDLVFNTRVKDTMIGRTDSKNRSITNLLKATSFKRLDQITNPNDDYQQLSIPPTTPTHKDSHYYHYHLPSNTVSSTANENLNRPILPQSPLATVPTPAPTYNYDYLRAKSKEYVRPTYNETNYTPETLPNRSYDDHGYASKPTSSITDKNSTYTSITNYPSYQTPGSSKRRIKKYLLAKGGSSSGLSHQTEPIVTNFENISLLDGDNSNTVIANNHALTPSSPPPPPPIPSPPRLTSTKIKAIIPSLHTTPPIPTLSPPSSPPPASTSNTTVDSVVFSTPNAQLSPSPPNTNIINQKNPSALFLPLTASLTTLTKQQQQQQQQQSNSNLELLLPHAGKEQSPSRSIISTVDDEGRRNNHNNSSESRHITNGNSTTDRAESITSATSASKRQKKANNNYQHQLKRSTSSSHRKVSSSVFNYYKIIELIRMYANKASYTFIIEYIC